MFYKSNKKRGEPSGSLHFYGFLGGQCLLSDGDVASAWSGRIRRVAWLTTMVTTARVINRAGQSVICGAIR